jgi:hypothetical protein
MIITIMIMIRIIIISLLCFFLSLPLFPKSIFRFKYTHNKLDEYVNLDVLGSTKQRLHT